MKLFEEMKTSKLQSSYQPRHSRLDIGLPQTLADLGPPASNMFSRPLSGHRAIMRVLRVSVCGRQSITLQLQRPPILLAMCLAHSHFNAMHWATSESVFSCGSLHHLFPLAPSPKGFVLRLEESWDGDAWTIQIVPLYSDPLQSDFKNWFYSSVTRKLIWPYPCIYFHVY